MISKKLIAAAGVFGFAGASFAQIGAFKYAATPAASEQNASAGKIERIEAESNTNKFASSFNWQADFSPTQDGTLPDGFWLVVSNGPNPKGIAAQLAIFYLDATTSTPKLTAYAYNGVNGNTSFLDGSPDPGTQSPFRLATSLHQTTDDQFGTIVRNNADGTRTLGFSALTTGINRRAISNDWEGAKFGDKIGVWFHPVANTKTSYDDAGYLKTFNPGTEGWYDVENKSTVPEPASLAAIGIGLLGVAHRRRAKKA